MEHISPVESPDGHSCLKESFTPRSPWVLLVSDLGCQWFLAVTCSEMGACPRRPLPSSCPYGWSCMYIVIYFPACGTWNHGTGSAAIHSSSLHTPASQQSVLRRFNIGVLKDKHNSLYVCPKNSQATPGTRINYYVSASFWQLHTTRVP